MKNTSLSIAPITPNIGAKITGIDLGKPLSDDIMEEIYQALIKHLVIFFEDQNCPPASHLRFAKSFGDLDVPHPIYQRVEGFESITKLANDANNPPDTDGWHTDLTFKDNPPFASILVAREVPPFGGDTLWSSQIAAYEALPLQMKDMLESMKAVHDMGDFRNNFTVGETSGDKLTNAMERFGCAIHDIVKTHPVTGKKFLYVNEGFTTHTIGQTRRESNRLLEYLLDHINRPEYQTRFSWQKGHVAMWDNRCTQHYAVSDYLPNYRCMNRITVVNDQRIEKENQREGR